MSARTAVLISAITLTLVGCGGQPSSAQKDLVPTKAAAVLRPDIESIIFPLDKYDASQDELNTIERAGNIKIQECMSAHDQPTDLMSTFKDRPPMERPYGIWVSSVAEVYGYGRADQDLGMPDLEGHSPEWNRQWDQCLSEAIPSAEYGGNRDSVTNRLRSEAGRAAKADNETKNLIKSWKDCLTKQGAHFSDADMWSPIESNGDKESAIRTALADIQCKDTINFVQKMANIEASYQATLIAKHEAELLAQRQKVDKTLSAASQTISSFTGA